ncbi:MULTISPECIES: acyl-homoserine-lactone synthase [unclassified Mesorhizobium]|uniref:acyl-homoserine-lactone synthase n=1 Tax=unclassified Mesorhizobium TaxID=325217 RepID=UPI001126EB07|nr:MULTISPECIES: acyl-homoserine-lactone synthase [unclassified Mesorhizobium]MBZ9898313.1 GNAT family N-acetyltransferase [Mesorhizobium sp. BR1-1-6]TPM57401.1 GNAT family N-acetyltransferase [Mesorhizobium sp. B2-2-4]TPM65795.1 GNAT family N-acetyltransferase [Mesorhizobium sp. B2-2-1]TPM98701.1 GNAT family N-acetyltransferase [Mesorhizobium sp. B2-1-5]TPN30482.1 GNAT family N-acetyltransferase [Mesorhizobium sp. B1-1-6]
MQIVAVRNGESSAGDGLIDQMHALRARVFRDRLGWNVTVKSGRETDEYDALDPTYLLAVTDDLRNVAGCARLLPATGPTMLGQTFPVLLGSDPMPCHSGLIESSRFCVDTELGSRNAARGLHKTTMALFAGILEWSLVNGYCEVATVTDIRFEKILGRAGLPFNRLGSPHPIGNTIAVAGIVPATLQNALRVRANGYQPFSLDARPLAA